MISLTTYPRFFEQFMHAAEQDRALLTLLNLMTPLKTPRIWANLMGPRDEPRGGSTPPEPPRGYATGCDNGQQRRSGRKCRYLLYNSYGYDYRDADPPKVPIRFPIGNSV